jgi:hypothetical protein
MKRSIQNLVLSSVLFIIGGTLLAQTEKPYDPTLNAREQLTNATEKAVLESKHVFVMIGGNW